jgi:16S rRNA (guanine1207-N2)-methyltransferase
MSDEHYFSQTPQTKFKPKEIRVELAGHEVTDHIDQGTAVLLAHLDRAPAGGNILDIGCGWGPIALALAFQSPRATIWAIDVNDRSLQLTTANAQRLGLKNIKVMRPEDVPANVTFSGIWSNPPIRVGKAELHSILNTWLPRLDVEAEAHLVVQKNLGADSLHRWLEAELPAAFSTIRLDTAKSFRVLRVKNRA